MKDLRTIILAAGKGTRMKSSLPKVLHPVCGRPMIDYVLEKVSALGSLKTYAVLGHQYETIQQRLPKNIVCVRQKKLLGTADAVQSVVSFLKKFHGTVLVVCGDTPLLQEETLRRLLSYHKQTDAVCTVLSALVDDPSGYGRIIRNHNGEILAIREDKDATTAEKEIAEINTGVYCLRSPDFIKTLQAIKLNPRKKEFYITDSIELFVAQGLKVSALMIRDAREGLGINTREDLAVASSVIRQRILKKFMAEGVTIVDPATTHIDREVEIGEDTVIAPFTVIENDVKIGRHCKIGPFAHLRPGTRIDDEVEVGNFAEVSRTHLGKKTLMKHFSFLGDARVGSQVNIGAGTVTANYDGKNKNKTHIANKAFIGSDSVLIAPVHVGEQAVTAAGSVVTKGTKVPAKGLALGVPARVTKRKKDL